MSIFVIGLNHKTAPISLREKVYFALDKLPLYLQDLITRGYASEAVLLSTCNRSELYCETDNITIVRDWFCEQTSVSSEELLPALYIYNDYDAVVHIMEVACGLDSMVLGEPQILGQMKEAFSESCTASAVSASFHRLFHQVFNVAKDIRTTTAIGACPVSVASAAVHFVRERFESFAQASVTLIGAGDTANLLARYLKSHLSKPITLVNRSLEKISRYMEEFGCYMYSLDNMLQALIYADVVFSATGSATPLINESIMREAMQLRRHKPIMMVDIAVPRDIEANVTVIPNVSLYCIDDLKNIIENNRQGREHAAVKAREMIHAKTTELMAEMKSLDKVAYVIRAYRSQIEELCRAELIKAKQQLHKGMDPAEVLEVFAYAFTKKLLHTPSVQLRQAGVEGRFELLKFANQLFAISDPELELS